MNKREITIGEGWSFNFLRNCKLYGHMYFPEPLPIISPIKHEHPLEQHAKKTGLSNCQKLTVSDLASVLI